MHDPQLCHHPVGSLACRLNLGHDGSHEHLGPRWVPPVWCNECVREDRAARDTPEAVERAARLAAFIRDRHHPTSHGRNDYLGAIPGTNARNVIRWTPKDFAECIEPECVDARAALAAMREGA